MRLGEIIKPALLECAVDSHRYPLHVQTCQRPRVGGHRSPRIVCEREIDQHVRVSPLQVAAERVHRPGATPADLGPRSVGQLAEQLGGGVRFARRPQLVIDQPLDADRLEELGHQGGLDRDHRLVHREIDRERPSRRPVRPAVRHQLIECAGIELERIFGECLIHQQLHSRSLHRRIDRREGQPAASSVVADEVQAAHGARHRHQAAEALEHHGLRCETQPLVPLAIGDQSVLQLGRHTRH